MAGLEVETGCRRRNPDGTETREVRRQCRDEFVEEYRIRCRIQEDQAAARDEYWRLVDAGEPRKVAAAVVEAANRQAREQLAELDARAKEQTTVTTTRRGWPAARVSRAAMDATATRPTRRTGTRTRGAGRPAARPSSSSRGGDSGDDGSGPSDPPPPALRGPAPEREDRPLDQRQVAPSQHCSPDPFAEGGRS